MRYDWKKKYIMHKHSHIIFDKEIFIQLYMRYALTH